ncbi:unnamed protein product [Candidula unifasciata]|uniref:U4/U6.U5 tri-snRNP-associated protein 1 n=1 Tax=Candidula unifasciata TaxID=100452 RepID=A0A8S3YE20_9EUPU|nr:unnamed protein product [Candidula unifasciata]
MGSSKKHKEKDREGKKKRKHRSKSRSRSRERKRRHRDRSRSKSPGNDRGRETYEASYKDSGFSDDPRAISIDYNHAYVNERNRDQRPPEPREDSQPAQNSGERLSLSIEETNRLRAKLGLKPLDGTAAKGDDSKGKKQDAVHAPPVNLAQQRKTEVLREKMATKKSQREVEKRLQRIKGLGESESDDEGAAAWVSKNRQLQAQRELAEKTAKMLEEMDEDFGIKGLVEQEFKKDEKKHNYSSYDLRGLTVEHGLEKFSEGRDVILTIKDKGVLDEDESDVLVNVNIEDDERAEKNVDNKKKKVDYKPYDEPQFDEYGMMKPAAMLSKYDEEIDGVKKESFTLGSGGVYDAAHEKRMIEIRQQLRAQGQTLDTPGLTLATEYMTKEEMEAAKFKKTKKKVRKIRKKDILKADDLLPLPEESTVQDYGSRMRGKGRFHAEVEDEMSNDGDKKEQIKTEETNPVVVEDVTTEPTFKIEVDDDDIIGPDEDLSGVAVKEDEAQNELQGMLAKARKIKLKKERVSSRQIIEQIQPGTENSSLQNQTASNIILNCTSEFCRNLGEIPTYGLAGNREEDRGELMDMELELMEQRRKQEDLEEATGGWNAVDIDDKPVDIRVDEAVVLEEEPISSEGVVAALMLAQKKGYLEAEAPKKLPALSLKALELQAQNYTIQDKRYDDLDEKNRKRDRYQGGMITEFKEKDSYKPEVKLDYVDDSGRALSAKEAFRQLSHRFHGKGSGKKKTEKRSKKVEEELLMKRMSSTDTPLNTLSLLKDKQKSEKSPYIVLSGSKGFTSNNIVKPT